MQRNGWLIGIVSALIGSTAPIAYTSIVEANKSSAKFNISHQYEIIRRNDICAMVAAYSDPAVPIEQSAIRAGKELCGQSIEAWDVSLYERQDLVADKLVIKNEANEYRALSIEALRESKIFKDGELVALGPTLHEVDFSPGEQIEVTLFSKDLLASFYEKDIEGRYIIAFNGKIVPINNREFDVDDPLWPILSFFGHNTFLLFLLLLFSAIFVVMLGVAVFLALAPISRRARMTSASELAVSMDLARYIFSSDRSKWQQAKAKAKELHSKWSNGGSD